MNTDSRAYLAATCLALPLFCGLLALIHTEQISPEQAAQMRISEDMEGLQALQSAINSAPVTGQNVTKLLANCRTAAKTYNTAAAADRQFLPAGYPAHLDPSKECKP